MTETTNTAQQPLVVTMPEQQDDPSTSSFAYEFKDLDWEIRRMSLHADAILDSIRQVSQDDEKKGGENKKQKTKKIDCGDDDDDDDDESSSHHGAGSSSDDVNVVVKSDPTSEQQPVVAQPVARMQSIMHDEDDEDDDMKEEMERLDSIVRTIQESLVQQEESDPLSHDDWDAPWIKRSARHHLTEDINEALLLGCTIVWLLALLLLLHGQYFLLDTNGNVQLPFGLLPNLHVYIG